MKKVLSLLVAFTFMQVQTWALSGGPNYNRGGGGPSPSALVGTYSGVLIPDTIAATTTTTQAGPSSIGLFSVTIPTTGLANGGAIIFVNGASYSGNILGIGDPDKGTLSAVFSGASSFDIEITPARTVVNGTTVTVIPAVRGPISATGSLETKIIRGAANAFSGGTGGTTQVSSFFTTTTTTTDVGTNDGARVTGTAEIDTFRSVRADGTPIISTFNTYTVDGFKQSNTVSSTTTNFSAFFF